MLVLCGGALAVGMAASLVLPFVPFASLLMLAIGVGAVWAGRDGIAMVQVALNALALLVATQVGYGLGLVGIAALRGARQPMRRAAPAKPVLPDLHMGEKP